MFRFCERRHKIKLVTGMLDVGLIKVQEIRNEFLGLKLFYLGILMSYLFYCES